MKKEKQIMPQKDLRKLQLIELEMLLEVDRICREKGIIYCLGAGTALGAVRHRGFIPWDDDLDIYMLRTEYEKFCKICETELNKQKFFLQNDKTDQEYRWGYGKVRRKGTEYLREGQEMIRCFSGVSIDIFPFDYVPRNLFGKMFFHITRRICIKTLWSVVGAESSTNPFLRVVYNGLKHIDKSIPLSIMERMAHRSNEKMSDGVRCTAFFRNDYFVKKKECWIFDAGMPAEFFSKRTEIEFEGFQFYIFSQYEQYLTEKYGDYWEYPPESKRLLHSPKRYSLDVDIDLRGQSVEDYMNREYLYLTKGGSNR